MLSKYIKFIESFQKIFSFKTNKTLDAFLKEEINLKKLTDEEKLFKNFKISKEEYKEIENEIFELNKKIDFMISYKKSKKDKLNKRIEKIKSNLKEITSLQQKEDDYLELLNDEEQYNTLIELEDYFFLNAFLYKDEYILSGFENNQLVLNKEVTEKKIVISFDKFHKNIYSLFINNYKNIQDNVVIYTRDISDEVKIIKNNKPLDVRENIFILQENIKEIVIYSEADISFLENYLIVYDFEEKQNDKNEGYIILKEFNLQDSKEIKVNANECFEIFPCNFEDIDLSLPFDSFKKKFKKGEPLTINSKINTDENIKENHNSLICFFNTSENLVDKIKVFSKGDDNV